jgi:nitrite reductase/ring-hydroxylating ferredoxin subunit
MSSETGVDVGDAEAFVEGRPTAVRVDDRDVVVVRKGSEYFAVRDVCPHQGARLSGHVKPCNRGDQPILTREGEFLECPWHGWKVDLRTGSSPTEPDRVRVRAYDVTVDKGRVYIRTRLT